MPTPSVRTPATERIALRHCQAMPLPARLREPHGEDELALDGVDTRAAVALLERLVEVSPAAQPVASLSASDRDALLAALHRQLWGDRIVSSLRCPACEAWYDLSFELSGLQRHLARQVAPHMLSGPRCLQTADGLAWRLPVAAEEDEAAVLGIEAGAAWLATRCADDDGCEQQAAAALEALAPLIDVDLDAPCTECGQPQSARFDIQSFTLQRLLDERDALLAELHTIAAGYGWSLGEILSLPRSLRRSLAQRLGGVAAFG